MSKELIWTYYETRFPLWERPTCSFTSLCCLGASFSTSITRSGDFRQRGEEGVVEVGRQEGRKVSSRLFAVVEE